MDTRMQQFSSLRCAFAWLHGTPEQADALIKLPPQGVLASGAEKPEEGVLLLPDEQLQALKLPRLAPSSTSALIVVLTRCAQRGAKLVVFAGIGVIGVDGQRGAGQSDLLRIARPEAAGDFVVRRPGDDARRLPGSVLSGGRSRQPFDPDTAAHMLEAHVLQDHPVGTLSVAGRPEPASERP